MPENIRRLSRAETEALVSNLANAFAKAKGVEGALLGVAPDDSRSERVGKTPVHWVAVFEAVHHGLKFDGPFHVLVDLENGNAEFVNPR